MNRESRNEFLICGVCIYVCTVCCVVTAGNMEDRSSPTLVKALAGHKIVGVGCGSGDAHTIALEDNGKITRFF